MNEINSVNYVKATDLNRGKASSCIKNVHDNNCDTVILKNSEPYAVIISMEKYNEMISAAAQLERVRKYEDSMQ